MIRGPRALTYDCRVLWPWRTMDSEGIKIRWWALQDVVDLHRPTDHKRLAETLGGSKKCGEPVLGRGILHGQHQKTAVVKTVLQIIQVCKITTANLQSYRFSTCRWYFKYRRASHATTPKCAIQATATVHIPARISPVATPRLQSGQLDFDAGLATPG